VTFKHKVKHRIKHIRQSQDIDFYETIEGDTELTRQSQVTITEPEVTTPSPSKKNTISAKSPSSKSEKQVYNLLPFSEPKTKQCGQFLPYHFAHISKVPDLPNENGELDHSGHVTRSMTVNCNSILCEYCNSQHDTNGNVIYGDDGYPVPAGALKRTIDSHSEKLRKFQDKTGTIAKLDTASAKREFFKLFYGKKKTHHVTRDVFYTLVDRKMGPKQRRNLTQVINYCSEHHKPLNIYHHVLSPPSTWSGWETEEGTKHNIDHALDLLREIGCFGGYVYLHPYRIPDKYNDRIECADGPHFHFVGFSRIMQDAEREVCDREHVVFKALHHHDNRVDPVMSIEKTVGYIVSHVGVQRSREPVVRDLELLEKYHFVNVTDADVNGKPVSFILPDGESNFDSFKFPKQPLTISPEVFSNSLSYFTFLKTDGGRLFLLMRRYIKQILDQHDSIAYSISIKSNVSKKDRKIVMRNFGILSNSKNFIWGFKKEKPQFYCTECKDRIPLTQMFPCNVLSESLIGVLGPPSEPVFTGDLGQYLIDSLEYDEKKKAYEDHLYNVNSVQEKIQTVKEYNATHNLQPIDHKSNKDGWETIGREDPSIYIDSDVRNYFLIVPPKDLDKYYSPSTPDSDIYKIPLQYIHRLDINVADVVKTFFKVRK